MNYKKGDIVRLDLENNYHGRTYLDRDKLRGVVLEIRDNYDHPKHVIPAPLFRIKWATQHQTEWYYAEALTKCGETPDEI